MSRKLEDYFLAVSHPDAALAEAAALEVVAVDMARRVLRPDLTPPGFALIDLGPNLTARQFREVLVRLGNEIDRYCQNTFGLSLAYLSLGCFDQQATTRPHRDGAPDESLLLLGYEPTTVVSQLFLLDYAAAAGDAGMTPRQFIEARGLACRGCEEDLAAYTTEVAGRDTSHYQVLAVNNGLAADGRHGMLGVLHQAIVTRDPAQERRVVSVTLAGVRPGGPEVLSRTQVQAFLDAAGTCG